jgi:hypothetical protein
MASILPTAPPQAIPPATVNVDAKYHFTATGTVTPGDSTWTCANITASVAYGGTTIQGACQSFPYDAGTQTNTYNFVMTVDSHWLGQIVLMDIKVTSGGTVLGECGYYVKIGA